MIGPARGDPEGQPPPRATLVLTLLFVLAAIAVSACLVVYTAWRHDLENGPFAVFFAVLSAKASLSWFAWNDGDDADVPRSAAGDQPKQD